MGETARSTSREFLDDFNVFSRVRHVELSRVKLVALLKYADSDLFVSSIPFIIRLGMRIMMYLIKNLSFKG